MSDTNYSEMTNEQVLAEISKNPAVPAELEEELKVLLELLSLFEERRNKDLERKRVYHKAKKK